MTKYSTVLTDFEDRPLQDMIAMQASDDPTKVIELTLGRAISNSLNIQSADEAEMSGIEKFRRGRLAFHIRNNKEIELTKEDLELIKDKLAKLYTPVVIYRAYTLLDADVSQS